MNSKNITYIEVVVYILIIKIWGQNDCNFFYIVCKGFIPIYIGILKKRAYRNGLIILSIGKSEIFLKINVLFLF